ncbi:hypothetical protein ESCOCK425M_01225 [Escherichia coli]
MKKKRTLFFISSLMLLGSGTTIAGDNLHFTGNLISKSCTPVINGSQLAEVHFPAIAASDLMNLGQSERVPLVFQLKDCHSSTLFNVKPRFYVSTSKSIIKALINMHSFEIQLSPIG